MDLETREMVEIETIAPFFPVSEAHIKPSEVRSTEVRVSFFNQHKIDTSILFSDLDHLINKVKTISILINTSSKEA